MTLFEAYVRSILLFGGAIWGPSIVDGRGRVEVDASGRMGAFYHGCLRSLLDVGREVRNAVLYVLCAKPPLHVYVAK